MYSTYTFHAEATFPTYQKPTLIHKDFPLRKQSSLRKTTKEFAISSNDTFCYERINIYNLN